MSNEANMARSEDWIGQTTARSPGHAENDRRKAKRPNSHGWDRRLRHEALHRRYDFGMPRTHQVSGTRALLAGGKKVSRAVCFAEVFSSPQQQTILVPIMQLLVRTRRTRRESSELSAIDQTRLPKSADQSTIPYPAPAVSRVRFEVLGCMYSRWPHLERSNQTQTRTTNTKSRVFRLCTSSDPFVVTPF